MTPDERNDSPEPAPPPAYRTKSVQFLGRSTPIVLQNDNGPCPLLAICNVLLLRNSLSLVPETPEVPLHRLLSLVAEKLIDSNNHIQGKDDEYAINQQQNIADAIDLLPRLATGIDVNVQFGKIKDFEFTRECAIFDLLDIGLYHGWILDPQDTDTAAAIGSKSYNALVGELVSFDTNRSEGEDNGTVIEDSIDFAAATTATLGVPSPCLSRGRSFDDCQGPVPMGKGSRKGDKEEEEELLRALNLSKGSRKGDKEEEEELLRALNLSKGSRKGDKEEEEELLRALNMSKGSRKGDKEEEEELLRALNLSKADISSPVHVSVAPDTSSLPILEGNAHTESSEPENRVDSVEQIAGESEKCKQPDSDAPQRSNMCTDFKDDDLHSQYPSTENYTLSTNTDDSNKTDQLVSEGSEDFVTSSDLTESVKIDFLMPNPAPSFLSTNGDGSDGCNTHEGMTRHREDQSVSQTCTEDLLISEILQSPVDNLTCCDSAVCSDPVSQHTDLHSSNGEKNLPDVSEVGSSSLDEGEPIYEGEEHILDSAHSKFEDREPVYEGEVVLAEQADNTEDDTVGSNSNNRLTEQHYQLIKNFLESSASQLTIYGLFCLQEGLKERELCVFFRNNHFSTMFKFNGELYLLATDQGYISQPDLVWEKLNEVNGDTVFMTGNFTEFMVENQVNDSWNEQNAMDSTADYIAKFESQEPTSSSLNSDYQLAVALQQKEFEQQPQHPQEQNTHGSQVSDRSRLITGPQASRNSHAPQKNESKLKDKCTVM